MAANKEIVKDCRSAVQFEQELQISYAQRGVAVVDVYSSEWGPCRAITETFRRLLTDQGDGVHLRFLSVECNAILASLKSPEEQRNPQRPKNLDAIRDTLPEGWQHILEERCGQSKPFFLFYKEGKRVSSIDGVNTPLIRATVKDLCSVKTPASEFISNPRLQEFWDEQFNPEESEVAYDKFLKGLLAALKYTVALNDPEKATLGEAIALNKERMVTAEGLQKWIGDDELRTVHQAFLDTLPEYEARATAQAAKDEEERKVREAEARKKEEEEREAAEAKKKADAEEEARKAKAASAQQGGAHQVEQLLEKLAAEGIESHQEAMEGDAEETLRAAVRERSAPPTVPNRFGAKFLTSADAEEQAAQLHESVTANGKTLKAILRDGAGLSFKSVAALRHEAAEKVANEALPPMARAALLLLSGDEAPSGRLIGKPVDFANAVSSQTVLSEGGLITDVGFYALSTAVTAAPKDAEYTVTTTTEIVKTLLATLGGDVVLPPFTLLTPESDAEDRVSVTLTGIPMVVALWSEAAVSALHWYTKFDVQSINPLTGSVTLGYQGLVAEDPFTVKATEISTASNEDERHFAALQQLQQLPVSAEKPRKAAAPAPAAEEAEEAEEKKPAEEAAPQPPAEEPAKEAEEPPKQQEQEAEKEAEAEAASAAAESEPKVEQEEQQPAAAEEDKPKDEEPKDDEKPAEGNEEM